MRYLRVIAATIGGGLILLAVLAYRLGIDHNPAWGTSRVLLALLGGSLLLAALLSWQWRALEPLRRQISQAWRRIQLGVAAWWGRQPAVGAIRRAGQALLRLPGIAWLAASPARRAALAAWLGLAALGLIYVWYMTAGTLDQWFPYFHDYFDRLAQAFLHGQLALLEQPDPRLLALADPYTYANRAGVAYPWDVSLYQGRFYLYWGPVPGAILAVARLVTQARIEDQVVALAGQLGVGALLAANLAALRRKFAPRSNPLGLLLLILAGGANLFLLWPSGRPGVYEAAILSGQFFLLAGLLALFFGLQDPLRRPSLGLLAGLGFLLAIGSRNTLAVTVGWLACLLLWRAGRVRREDGRFPAAFVLAFFLPLAVGAAALLWYNYARFGSLLETGLSYQLSIPQYPPHWTWLFSPAYLLPNLYGYLLRAPLVEAQFPFVSVPFIQESAWPWYIRLPEHYIYHEPQVGLLVALPLAGFALIPLWRIVRDWVGRRSNPARHGERIGRPSGAGAEFGAFWTLALAGAAVLQAGVILVYFFSALRFQIEIVPLVFLLACLGIWRIDGELTRHPGWQRIFWLAVLLLSLYSLSVGLLGGLSAGDQRFEANNPHLYASLRDWFGALRP